jgi:hypothetical protein
MFKFKFFKDTVAINSQFITFVELNEKYEKTYNIIPPCSLSLIAMVMYFDTRKDGEQKVGFYHRS